ncbi:hypothetical protein Tco_1459817, partial [Tanacetum coccineum]
ITERTLAVASVSWWWCCGGVSGGGGRVYDDDNDGMMLMWQWRGVGGAHGGADETAGGGGKTLFNSFFKIKNLEHQIQEKDNVIRDLKVLVSNVNDRNCEPYNANDVTALIEQNECVRVELEKVKQHYKELYDSIKITRTHMSEKTSTMLNEIESLKAQLRIKESCFTSDYVKPKVLAPGMYVIDVKLILRRV